MFWFLLDVPNKTQFVSDFLVSCLGFFFPTCGAGRVEVGASAESETETPAWLRYCLHSVNRNRNVWWKRLSPRAARGRDRNQSAGKEKQQCNAATANALHHVRRGAFRGRQTFSSGLLCFCKNSNLAAMNRNTFDGWQRGGLVRLLVF